MFLTAIVLAVVSINIFINVDKVDPIKIRVRSNNGKKFF